MREDLHQALKRDFRRLQPMLPELFNLAYAVCGRYETAEYAMRSALLSVLQRTGHLKPSDGLRRQVLRAARRQPPTGEELTWDGLSELKAEMPVRRLAALVYGCELSDAQAARLAGFAKADVDDRLEKLEKAGGTEKAVKQWMKRPNADMPEAANVLRALEAELADGSSISGRVSGAFGVIVWIILLLLAGGLFWLAAVIFAPVRN